MGFLLHCTSSESKCTAVIEGESSVICCCKRSDNEIPVFGLMYVGMYCVFLDGVR